ncbi:MULTISPECIES: hypothetical protein [Citrobacter]|uniref:hypothetical protein n=1 Tax=Citrobacter TaxID=544 RepID=UPI0011402A07|nr:MULTISPECIES: hypothetical protein [Citrobacter]MBA8128305.1 hypothetical protein [Citrobacter sp. RHBSTW-00013]MDM3413300.1 hypothetical protein [Citrobacter sp. Cb018]
MDGLSWPYFFILAGALLVSGLISFSAYKACAPTHCKLAEEIFQLLGIESVARVNLEKTTKEKENHQKAKGEWSEPSDPTRLSCPSRKYGYLFEYWYYY